MTEENIRKRVVTSLRSAIDLENEDNDVEAYRKYLEGLALVAAALQQDAESSWTVGNPTLSGKERRSLVGFAKESVDRIIVLLDKQNEESTNVIKQTTKSLTDNQRKQDTVTCSAAKVDKFKGFSELQSTNPGHGAIKRNERVVDSAHNFVEESPMTQLKRENKLLLTRYASRIRAATTPVQRHNLQLELERRLTENAAIARQQQDVWQRRQNELTARCQEISDHKFGIREKIENGTITEVDFKKQRLYAAALQYEEENSWLKNLKQELAFKPQEQRLQRDIINQVLLDRAHPLGSLMCQMQYAVLDKVNPIILKHQPQLNPDSSNFNSTQYNVHSEHQPVLPDPNVNRNLPPNHSSQCNHQGMLEVANANVDEIICKEEQDAFQRHFQNVADDIKADIKFLETLLFVLFPPLTSADGQKLTTDTLHLLYFGPIKPYIITLLRLCTRQAEIEFASAMSSFSYNGEEASLGESMKSKACAGLHRLLMLHSPCQMLDCLVDTVKTVASVNEDNECRTLGADDLLPRFMAVVLTCGMPSLVAETTFMEAFMPTVRALGEAGYALTVLQSVLSCVQTPTG